MQRDLQRSFRADRLDRFPEPTPGTLRQIAWLHELAARWRKTDPR